jgi:hypothetical protein
MPPSNTCPEKWLHAGTEWKRRNCVTGQETCNRQLIALNSDSVSSESPFRIAASLPIAARLRSGWIARLLVAG